jgi:hypothetical protein
MAWSRNQYACENCKCKWQDEWSAMCDDDCSHCGSRHMTPYRSIDLTEIIEEDDGVFFILRSPGSAEDSPNYDTVRDFETREEAEAFLRDTSR